MISALDWRRTAVLSLDIQTALVSIYVKTPDSFLSAVGSVLEKGRSTGAFVIHVRVGFRPGFPEISERNRLFAAVKANPQHRQIFEGAMGSIHPAVAPAPEEVVITKSRISAFHGTDLSVILQARNVDSLVVFGIATSGVVLSTTLDASDRDYDVIVIKDCCADLDSDVHACLLEKLLPRRVTVVTAAELLEVAD